MKKNGFVSTALIYTFFIIFLILMVFLVNSYSSVRFLSEQLKEEIKIDPDVADINVFIYVYNDDPSVKKYEVSNKVPGEGYYLHADSNCENGSTIKLGIIDEETDKQGLIVYANHKDKCYAYFNKLEYDVIVDIYTKDDSALNHVDSINDVDLTKYKFSSEESGCITSGSEIGFNEAGKSFTFQTTKPTECKAVFVRK